MYFICHNIFINDSQDLGQYPSGHIFKILKFGQMLLSPCSLHIYIYIYIYIKLYKYILYIYGARKSPAGGKLLQISGKGKLLPGNLLQITIFLGL